MDQRIINLWDRFTHGGMNRRDFLDRLAQLAGSTAAAVALLPLLQSNYANATVAPDDARLAIDQVSYDSPKGAVKAYLARPKAKGTRPAVLVIHENRGLSPHIADVTRHLAVEGFLALAPDLLSISGGTPDDEDKARDLHTKTNREDMVTEAVAAVSFLKRHAESSGRVGAVGFCFGGGIINRLAVASPDLNAVVAYYGEQVPADQVPAIRAPLLLHYASLDQRINAGIAAYETALKANGKTYTIHMYEGVNHAFNNDTAGVRYDKAAADLAWGRTIAFFKQYLGDPPRAT